MRKQTWIALAAVAATLAFPPVARAADDKPATPAPPADRLAALRERMQETAKALSLTPEQKEKLQGILRDHAQKLRDLRQDSTLSAAEKRRKFQAVRDEITAEFKQVLTPEQFEKWKTRPGAATESPKRPMARIQEAIQDLNLTDAQKEQLRPLYEQQMEKLRGLHQNTSLSMSEKLEKLKALHQDAAPKLKQVLTPEQYAKWEKDVNQWLEDLKQHFIEGKQN